MEKRAQVTVYTSASQLRSPGTLVRAMWRDLLSSRELAWQLTVRDIKARYRQAALGLAWAFIPPLATALVFILINRAGVINIESTDIPYPAYVIIGTTLWQTFLDSLMLPIRVVNQSGAMLVKINFAREALALSALGQTAFNLGIRLVILVVVLAVFPISLTWGLVLAPLAIVALMLLGTVIGLLLTPLAVLYTDVETSLTTLTTVWFFLTPVVYPPPAHWPYSLIADLNPVSPILLTARDLMTKGTIPDPAAFGVVVGLTVLGLLLAWVLFRVSIPIVIERIGS